MSSNIKNIIDNIDLSKNYVVALSGGVDSSVLAHIMANQSVAMRLVFVQHNQKDSKKLEKVAKKISVSLNLEFKALPTSLNPKSSETKMRDERYKVLLSDLKEEEILADENRAKNYVVKGKLMTPEQISLALQQQERRSKTITIVEALASDNPLYVEKMEPILKSVGGLGDNQIEALKFNAMADQELERTIANKLLESAPKEYSERVVLKSTRIECC